MTLPELVVRSKQQMIAWTSWLVNLLTLALKARIARPYPSHPINRCVSRRSSTMSLKRKASRDLLPDGSMAPTQEISSLQAHLRRFFPHHQNFKEGQDNVIGALLRGENAAAIFPTGGGKSLCYQLPGLILAEEGMTLVVSPLLALMKDQVDAARSMKHPVDLLASSLTLEERIAVIRRVRNRETAILYVAPEQLNNEVSVALIKSVPLSLIAIDEAHCISEWGNSFRPDYLRLAKFCRDWKVPRTVALTATATPKVVQDICRAFEIHSSNCIRTAFFRPNLKFQFIAMSTEEERRVELVKAIEAQPLGSAIIVYATLQETTEQVSDFLNQHAEFDSRSYHAGLPQERRKETQDWFMSSPEELDSSQSSARKIVVATIAFGMGVDKRDIRCIIHYNLPKSLESYAQEIGRAGRDGKESNCLVLVRPDDMAQLEAFACCGSPSLQRIEGVLRDFFLAPSGDFHPVGTARAVSHYSLGRAHDMTQQAVGMLLAFVDIHHGWIRQATPRYGLYKIKARDGRPVNQVASLLRSSLSRSCQAAGSSVQLSGFISPKRIWVDVNITAAAAASGKSEIIRDCLVQAISKLEQEYALEVMPTQVEQVYRIVEEPGNLTDLATTEYDRFKAREAQELGRIEQVLDFIAAADCQAKILTEYFEGADGPTSDRGQSVFPCGLCPYCKTKFPLQLPKRNLETVDSTLWDRLTRDPCLPRDDPELLIRFALGFKSPRITELKLDMNKNFGLMEGAPYKLIENKIRQGLF